MRTHFPMLCSWFALVAATVLVAACDSSPTGPRDARTFILVIKPSSATLLSGRQLQLNLTTQGAEDRVPSPADILWSSTDDGVATVTSDGVVTAKGNGAAQITAWWEGHRGFATVTVIERGRTGPCGDSDLAAGQVNPEKTSICKVPPPGKTGKQ